MLARAVTIPRLVRIPAGVFEFGGRDQDKFVGETERPRKLREIRRPFALGAFPVTESEYAAFDDTRPASALPAVGVSWLDASAYCRWLAAETRQPFRLPTEEEWEYACRAGSDFIFQRGDELAPDDACFLYDEAGFAVGGGARAPVGSYPLNAFGLGDLLGNVCEWTASAWTESLRPDEPPHPRRKTIRGGAWDYLPRLLRASWRDGLEPGTRRDNLGFRVARDIET